MSGIYTIRLLNTFLLDILLSSDSWNVNEILPNGVAESSDSAENGS